MPRLPKALTILNAEVVACRACPRLAKHREAIGREKRRAYRDHDYWARPVPGFGAINARLLILGLAPGAHGSNRTGRMFTGDASGRFLYPTLHRAGFASQPDGESRDDGLRLLGCYITAAVRCAPPENKPTPREIARCATYLDREIAALRRVRVVVALGRIGFDAYLNHLRRTGVIASRAAYKFGHGAEYAMPNGVTLLASYHPSNQNTATGRLTGEMFLKIFQRVKKVLG